MCFKPLVRRSHAGPSRRENTNQRFPPCLASSANGTQGALVADRLGLSVPLSSFSSLNSTSKNTELRSSIVCPELASHRGTDWSNKLPWLIAACGRREILSTSLDPLPHDHVPDPTQSAKRASIGSAPLLYQPVSDKEGMLSLPHASSFLPV